MLTLIFTNADGAEQIVTAPPGISLMEAARNAGVAGIIAECGGACSCSTCHVHVAPDWMARIAPAAETETDLLDFAHEPDEYSRLACQVRLTDAHDGLRVRIPERQG